MKCRGSYEATWEFTISAACVWFTWQPLEDQCAWNFVLDIYRKICICNIFSRSCQSSNLTKVTCFVLKVLKTPNSPSSLPMVQFLIISFHSSWRNLVQQRRYKIKMEWLICTSMCKIVLSHMTTSSASFLSWISPSYANLFSPSPAGTCRRRNVGNRERERENLVDSEKCLHSLSKSWHGWF